MKKKKNKTVEEPKKYFSKNMGMWSAVAVRCKQPITKKQVFKIYETARAKGAE